MHRAGVFPAARPGTMEAGAGLEADHDVQLLPAAVGVTEAHGPHPSKVTATEARR